MKAFIIYSAIVSRMFGSLLNLVRKVRRCESNVFSEGLEWLKGSEVSESNTLLVLVPLS